MSASRDTRHRRRISERTLDATMRAPSTATPDVVVLDAVTEEKKRKVAIDPKKDLWLSTVDG
jgi:hypothetical protein